MTQHTAVTAAMAYSSSSAAPAAAIAALPVARGSFSMQHTSIWGFGRLCLFLATAGGSSARELIRWSPARVANKRAVEEKKEGRR